MDKKRFNQCPRSHANLHSAGNVWAANGIGAVLAERGSLTDAHAVLAQVQDGAAAAEALLPMPDVLLNMANLQLAQQDYYSAIQMYTATLRRFHHNKDSTVMLYLARSV